MRCKHYYILKRNRSVSLESIEKICIVLNCGLDEILEFITEDINSRRL
ncbi:helix-turn-helix domain-containing protein [Bacillus cereus]